MKIIVAEIRFEEFEFNRVNLPSILSYITIYLTIYILRYIYIYITTIYLTIYFYHLKKYSEFHVIVNTKYYFTKTSCLFD